MFRSVHDKARMAERRLAELVVAAYRRDKGSRRVQRQAARLLRASAHAEKRFERDVAAAMRGVHAGIRGALERELAERAPEERRDAARSFPPELEHRLFEYVRLHVGPAFGRMARTVNQDNQEALALFGITPATVPGLAGLLASAREDAIRRVQGAAKTYTDEVQGVLEDPDNIGLTHDELAELLEERGRVSESTARFLARDTTLRTNAAVTKARQTAAGVTAYRWSTSRDERVRETHAELEGEKYDYDDPPVTNDAGDTNNPGEDWQCRCAALPVIDELEEEEPSGERLPDLEEEPEEEMAAE